MVVEVVVLVAIKHWSIQSHMKPPAKAGWLWKASQYSARLPVLLPTARQGGWKGTRDTGKYEGLPILG